MKKITKNPYNKIKKRPRVQELIKAENEEETNIEYLLETSMKAIKSDSSHIKIHYLLSFIRSARSCEDSLKPINLVKYLIDYVKRQDKDFPTSALLRLIEKNLGYELYSQNLTIFNEFIKRYSDDYDMAKSYFNKEISNLFPFIHVSYSARRLKKFALDDYLIDVFHLKRIEKTPAYWNGYVYLNGGESVLDLIASIEKVFEIDINENNQKRIIKRIDDRIESVDPYSIPCLDKVVCIDTDEPNFSTLKIIDPTPKLALVNPLQVELGDVSNGKDLEEKLFSAVGDEYIKAWSNNDREIEQLIEEMLGALIIHGSGAIFKKSFYIYNKGANTGKTTFLTFLLSLCGESNTSQSKIESLEGRFDKIPLVGKRANLCDEMPKDYKLNPMFIGTFKSIINCVPYAVEYKGINIDKAVPMTATFIFACNDVPYWNDTALDRRTLIIPFLHTFRSSDVLTQAKESNNNLTKEITKHLFLCGLRGALRLMKNIKEKKGDPFTNSQASTKCFEEIKMNSDPLYRYIKENEDNILSYENVYLNQKKGERFYTEGHSVKEKYQRFKEYCEDNGLYKSKSIPNCLTFQKRVCDVLGVVAEKGDFRSAVGIPYDVDKQPLVFRK